MEQSSPILANPFALMLNPEAVLRAVESSHKLSSLQSRVCRPLDSPNPQSEFDSLDVPLTNWQEPEATR
ncbi:MAG: hypothetical protein ACK53K_04455 [Burkholderiales bacterium]|jgi:hypothetical protein